MKQGIQAFISYTYTKNDVWLITMKDMMQWVKNPIENSHLTKGYWICQFNDKIKCSEQTSNSTTKKVTFAAIINVDQIWIWQTAFLVVLYIVIYRYDKYMQEKKKK
ncbi:hypothetical protein LSH36_465g02063 [Paralvinella palmiformis]|uniref:Uncharacterized protein n=1 Tax=Paralvinella palmiformis TaxID=53620 RepID=A0AAD9MXJ8_9ANNE|nr:hypothetical protein LSH36_465g02063 [Paralvinella palmiformis]